jgi:hypothetical protein
MDSTIASYQNVLERLQFTILDFSQDFRTIYAKSTKSNTVHLINTHLLKYFAKDISKAKYSDEFSYKVAENTEEFYQYKNKGLLPRDFYDYHKIPLKIINHSSFSVTSIKRKLFIVPFIFEMGGKADEPHLVDGFIYADKVEKGETLDQALKRILSTELKISKDYIRAAVAEEVDFAFDREGKLTPRLHVILFIKQKEVLTERSIAKKVVNAYENASTKAKEIVSPDNQNDKADEEFIKNLYADMEKLSIITDLSVERKEDLLRLVKESLGDTKQMTLSDVGTNLAFAVPRVIIDTAQDYNVAPEQVFQSIARAIPGFEYVNSQRFFLNGVEKSFEELSRFDNYETIIDATVLGEPFYLRMYQVEWETFIEKINEIASPKLGFTLVNISDKIRATWIPVRNDLLSPQNIEFLRKYIS